MSLVMPTSPKDNTIKRAKNLNQRPTPRRKTETQKGDQFEMVRHETLYDAGLDSPDELGIIAWMKGLPPNFRIDKGAILHRFPRMTNHTLTSVLKRLRIKGYAKCEFYKFTEETATPDYPAGTIITYYEFSEFARPDWIVFTEEYSKIKKEAGKKSYENQRKKGTLKIGRKKTTVTADRTQESYDFNVPTAPMQEVATPFSAKSIENAPKTAKVAEPLPIKKEPKKVDLTKGSGVVNTLKESDGIILKCAYLFNMFFLKKHKVNFKFDTTSSDAFNDLIETIRVEMNCTKNTEIFTAFALLMTCLGTAAPEENKQLFTSINGIRPAMLFANISTILAAVKRVGCSYVKDDRLFNDFPINLKENPFFLDVLTSGVKGLMNLMVENGKLKHITWKEKPRN